MKIFELLNAYGGIISSLLGVLVGAILVEYIRRKNRLENFMPLVLERKLKILEELFIKIVDFREVVNSLVSDKKLTKDEAFSVENDIVMELCKYCDRYEMYINEYMTVQCCTLFMDVHYLFMKDEDEDATRSEKDIMEDINDTLYMIKEELGINKINKRFVEINRPKHSSAVIDYFEELKKERVKENKEI